MAVYLISDQARQHTHHGYEGSNYNAYPVRWEFLLIFNTPIQ